MKENLEFYALLPHLSIWTRAVAKLTNATIGKLSVSQIRNGAFRI